MVVVGEEEGREGVGEGGGGGGVFVGWGGGGGGGADVELDAHVCPYAPTVQLIMESHVPVDMTPMAVCLCTRP